MRQYTIDQLSREERDNIDSYLKRTLRTAGLDGLFFLEIPPDLYGAAQQGHDQCGPFFFAIELAEEEIRFELLVRSQSNLHCSCIAYATAAQREFLMAFADTLLESEKITA